MNSVISLVDREWKNYYRDRMAFILGLFFPFFFLGFISLIMGDQAKEIIPGTDLSFGTSLLLGFVATNTMIISFNGGMSLIQDADSGVLREILVSPMSRTKVLFAKIIGNMMRVLITVTIFFTIGCFIYNYAPSFDTVLVLAGLVILGSFAFSVLAIFLASLSSSSTSFQSVISLATFILLFISPAYLNPASFPGWANIIVFLNPLTYLAVTVKYYGLGLFKLEEITNEMLVDMGVYVQFGDFIVTAQIALVVLIIMAVIFFALGIWRFNKLSVSKVKVKKNDPTE